MIERTKAAMEVWHVVTVVVSAIFGVLAWFYITFQTAEAADVSHQEIVKEMTTVHDNQAKEMAEARQEMSEIRELLTLKIQQDKLDQVNRDIKNNDTEQFTISQWIKLNGEDNQSVKRLQDLKNEREQLSIKRTCIISNNRMCNQ